jgi:hypothetical protein
MRITETEIASMSAEQRVKCLDEQVIMCVEQAKDKWTYFTSIFLFQEGVQLSVIIESFLMPLREFVENEYPILLSNPKSSDEMFWLIVLAAVRGSKTHAEAEVRQACIELSKKFGPWHPVLTR